MIAEKFEIDNYKYPVNTRLISRTKSMGKNMTKSECKMWFDILKPSSYKWTKQRIIGNYIVDFFCYELAIVIEVDGDSHISQGEYDNLRTKFLESMGIVVIRFNNVDVLSNTSGVFDRVNEICRDRLEVLLNCSNTPVICDATPSSGGLLLGSKKEGIPQKSAPFKGLRDSGGVLNINFYD